MKPSMIRAGAQRAARLGRQSGVYAVEFALVATLFFVMVFTLLSTLR